jgi:hypothetical protein
MWDEAVLSMLPNIAMIPVRSPNIRMMPCRREIRSLSLKRLATWCALKA